MTMYGLSRNDNSFGHRQIGGSLRAGNAVANAVPVVARVATGCAKAGLLLFEATCDGTLSFAWVRPDSGLYTTGNPANVAVTADTQITPLVLAPLGRGALQITFTPAADGAITVADVTFTD